MIRQEFRGSHDIPENRIQRVLDELKEHNEVKSGEAYLVRIPRIEGKIFIRNGEPHGTYVEYICESWYDKEKEQMRNRRMQIGQCLASFPGAMLPNENYYQYFNRENGELKAEMEKDPEETEQEETDVEAGTEETNSRKRMRILLDVFSGMRDVIKNRAKKHPAVIVNRFQAQQINEVLRVIREIEERKGYGELLELIAEPQEVEMDGQTVTVGMSYSDAELVMECYNSVIWFTQGEL